MNRFPQAASSARKRLISAALVLISSVLSTACSRTPPPRPVEVQFQTVEVPVRAPCPDPAERERLRAGRPARLADQPMPDTPRERVAKTAAQLGRYEAPGGWADQVDAVLDRCQRP